MTTKLRQALEGLVNIILHTGSISNHGHRKADTACADCYVLNAAIAALAEPDGEREHLEEAASVLRRYYDESIIPWAKRRDAWLQADRARSEQKDSLAATSRGVKTTNDSDSESNGLAPGPEEKTQGLPSGTGDPPSDGRVGHGEAVKLAENLESARCGHEAILLRRYITQCEQTEAELERMRQRADELKRIAIAAWHHRTSTDPEAAAKLDDALDNLWEQSASPVPAQQAEERCGACYMGRACRTVWCAFPRDHDGPHDWDAIEQADAGVTKQAEERCPSERHAIPGSRADCCLPAGHTSAHRSAFGDTWPNENPQPSPAADGLSRAELVEALRSVFVSLDDQDNGFSRRPDGFWDLADRLDRGKSKETNDGE